MVYDWSSGKLPLLPDRESVDKMIETINTSIDASQPETIKSIPYPPSFLDRFMEAVKRLPIPYWLTYLGLFILESIIFHILSWIDGWLPAYTINPILFLFPLWQWVPFAIITYLNSISLGAVASFAPLLDMPEQPLQRLKNEFTSMPGRSVIISGAIWSFIYFIIVYMGYQAFFSAHSIGTLLTVAVIIEGLVSYSTGGIIYYHSIRQLRMVYRTVNLAKGFNLFHLDPVYAFSLVTSRTGASWVLLLSLTLLMFPITLAPIPIFALLIMQIGMALSAFTLPLQIVHHHLVLEKRRLLRENHQRLNNVLVQLHQDLDKNALGEIMEFNSTISALNTERDILIKIPTYPWRSGMLTNFLSISVLPIILFLIQFGIGHWLSK